MADALDTVQKLMALALNNPHVEEARSAALKAVQLIRAHGFVVQAKASPVVSHPSLQEVLNRQHAATQAQQQQAAYYSDFLNRDPPRAPFVWPKGAK